MEILVLLTLPALCIAYLVAPYATLGRARITYRHDVAANDIKGIRIWAQSQLDQNPKIEFYEYDIAALWRELENPKDPWGNDYQIVNLETSGLFDSNSTCHAYSMGEDGISNSLGNDVDDINSWNFDRDKHYGTMIARDSFLTNLWRIVIIAPIIYGLIALLVMKIYWSREDAG